MLDESRIRQLLEEALESERTPEEVCRDCPELLPVVRQRWQKLQSVQAQIDALFPTPAPGGDTAKTALPPVDAELPQIDGYDVEALLGRGGMGVVYKARHQKLKRIVALKMLLSGPFAAPQELARFQREAEAVASLKCAHIVQVYDFGDLQGRPYFTMEFVEGGSLEQFLAGTPQPARRAAELVATLASAVEVAHQSGIVHRDLKPSNILLTADGSPKISDFGLARRVDAGPEFTLSGARVGTPSYMAPEQALGKVAAVGPAADVYALGAILYEALTGRPPFRAETASETERQVISEEPAPPSRLNAKVPRDLETICLKCLHKEPSRRYASAADLAEDLQRFVRGEPIAARPAGRWERLARLARRHPAAFGLLATLVLLAAAIGAGVMFLYQQQLAARARGAEIDQDFRDALARERGLLDEGWLAQDLAKLTQARNGGSRIRELVRSGGASAAVQQEAEALRDNAAARLEQAIKNRALMEAVLDVAGRETLIRDREQADAVMALAPPSVDAQFADAFRRWGLDVDAEAEADVIKRLSAEPAPVVQELIAALDAWMMERRHQQRPEAAWRRLIRVADRLDQSVQHRQLRALLVGESPPDAASLAGLVGAASPWQTLWELTRGTAGRHLLGVQNEIDPRTAPALSVALLAQAYTAVGDAAKAETLLRRATTTRPDQVLLLDVLAKLLERQGPARRAEAIEYYRAARSQRRQLGMALSTALLAAHRTEEAEDVLQELAPQQFNNPTFYYLRGLAAYHLKKQAEAEAAWRKVLELKSDFAEAHCCLGFILNDEAKYSEAEAACRKAIELKPALAEAHSGLGSALGGQGKFREAEAACRKAIDIKPDNAASHSILAGALIRQGKYREAETACRKAIELKPDFAEAHGNLGNALNLQGRYALAEGAYRKAIELHADPAQTYCNLSGALMGQQKYREAETACRKAIELKPDFANAYYNLGNALKSCQQFTEAEAAYRKTIGLNPEFTDAYNELGGALLDQQKYAEAEAAYRKAISLVPEYTPAYHNLGFVLMQQLQFDQAAQALKKAAELFSANNPYREKARRLEQRCLRYAVLETRLPDIQGDSEKPASAADQRDLAQLCMLKKHHAAAARFFQGAFAAEPGLADAISESTRYNAACAAALAGCGQGKDAGSLNEKERALWRQQARDWLRQDLTLCSQAVDKGDAQTKAQVRDNLRPWKTDGNLAGVRAPDALTRLHDDERKQWERLWSDVDALLLRASQPQ
ncbi:MAG: hypothetical protein C5B56_05470 [Proteobacteria bacterium]|nr:MAG: hypothetical protein C5B56_05470 [Pseudomonadota bacterium]